MIIRILFFLIVILLSVCKNEDKRLNLIQGVWGESKDSNADFIINGNEIIYFEDPENYEIEIKNDSLKIIQDDEVLTTYKIIFMSKDKLELIPTDGEVFTLVKISN